MAVVRTAPRSLHKHLYVQVLVGIIAGIVVGWLWPAAGVALAPLGTGFIKLIRMLLPPVIAGTIVLGIARMDDLKQVGRVGVKALIYFEIVSTLALAIGLVVVNIAKPGQGMNVDVSSLDVSGLSSYRATADTQTHEGVTGFLLNIVPDSIVGAFARGDMLPIILVSVLTGFAMARLGPRTAALVPVLEAAMEALFGVVSLVMKLAPIGAFGAMAFTIGRYGAMSLANLGLLIAAVYATSVLFVVFVLGAIARMSRVSLWKFLRYIKDEIVIVFATASTESVLPRMIDKLERLGCSRPVVGLVLPAGYAFNPDGTAIYLTTAAIFVAQATNTPLAIGDQLVLLGVLMLTSKGSAGVAGAGFVALAATLSTVQTIPFAGLVLLLGVDRFINEARAVTNLIGNGIATIAVAGWEGELDRARAARVLDGKQTLET
jgi:Na+/H+-dicarboxylate symporter